MKTFAGIPPELANYKNANILLQSIPYDGTSTWVKGSDKGFQAFLEAAENMELYDIETDTELYQQGIHILPDAPAFSSPEEMYQWTYSTTKELLNTNKFLSFFGGEHSISIGILKAFYERFINLTVLHIDAHADLRPFYEGTKYNHANAMHDASKNCNLIQFGIRSMDITEKEYMNYGQTYFADDILNNRWNLEKLIEQMTPNVYISLDLDAFDPSIMPATGTPEPGGLDWNIITNLIRTTAENRNIVGFDIVELAPIHSLHAPQFLAAKLYYKMLSYIFKNKIQN